jgi:hypothetical protein
MPLAEESPLCEGQEQPGSDQSPTSSSSMVVFISKSSQVRESWVDCVTTAWMGCQGPSPLALSLVLGQTQLQGVRQGSKFPNTPGLNWETNTLSAFWGCNERSVPGDVDSPTMWTMQKGQRHDTVPLLSHPGVPWPCSGVRSWNFSGNRAVPALPIRASCPASVLSSISLHHSLKHQCLWSCKRCQWWMKVVWPMCFCH